MGPQDPKILEKGTTIMTQREEEEFVLEIAVLESFDLEEYSKQADEEETDYPRK